MSALVVIPARGGSKGIPGKNTRLVGGQPLIARAVHAAVGSALAERVVVTTDDEQIRRLASDAGAEVLDRPPEIAGDESSSESALLHVLDELDRNGGRLPPVLAMVQCTSPFTTPADIDGTVKLVEDGADSALTVARSHGFLWRTSDGGGLGVNHNPAKRLRRQDRDAEYLETGSVYAMRTEGFRAARHRFFGRVELFIVPASRALEIDEPDDLLLAELLVRAQHDVAAREVLPRPLGAIVFDFDGVLTDNRVLVMHDGAEGVLCDRSDGLGIEMLRGVGIPLLVLSKEKNAVVAARCDKLGVECIQGVDDKLPAMSAWLEERGIDLAKTVYVGNDHNDVRCLVAAGCGVVVADAHAEAKSVADLVLRRPGGRGGVRELASLVLAEVGGS